MMRGLYGMLRELYVGVKGTLQGCSGDFTWVLRGLYGDVEVTLRGC